METEGNIGTATRRWKPRELLVAGIALAGAVAVAVVFALMPSSETFRTAPDLVARLAELGAPCEGYVSQSDDDTWGICHADNHSFVIVTNRAEAEDHIARWTARPYELDGSSVAAGDGWYMLGDNDYVSHVAKLLGADLLT